MESGLELDVSLSKSMFLKPMLVFKLRYGRSLLLVVDLVKVPLDFWSVISQLLSPLISEFFFKSLLNPDYCS